MSFLFEPQAGLYGSFCWREAFTVDATAMKKPIIQSFMESIRETDTEEYLKAEGVRESLGSMFASLAFLATCANSAPFIGL